MIIATNNKGKISELKAMFSDVEVKSLKEANIDVDVVEDGLTFYDNALKKAKEIYEITGEAVIADDSGLCISALDNWPGVMTHRFLDGTDLDRNNAIIEKMKDETNRECSHVTVLVYYDGENIITGYGELKGVIAKEVRGENGFGFDPIFELDNGLTLAEISGDEKNRISARALALNDLKNKLNNREEFNIEELINKINRLKKEDRIKGLNILKDMLSEMEYESNKSAYERRRIKAELEKILNCDAIGNNRIDNRLSNEYISLSEAYQILNIIKTEEKEIKRIYTDLLTNIIERKVYNVQYNYSQDTLNFAIEYKGSGTLTKDGNKLSCKSESTYVLNDFHNNYSVFSRLYNSLNEYGAFLRTYDSAIRLNIYNSNLHLLVFFENDDFSIVLCDSRSNKPLMSKSLSNSSLILECPIEEIKDLTVNNEETLLDNIYLKISDFPECFREVIYSLKNTPEPILEEKELQSENNDFTPSEPQTSQENTLDNVKENSFIKKIIKRK